MEDAAVAVVLHFVGGIDPAQRGEGEAGPVLAGDGDLHILTRRQIGEPSDAEGVVRGQAQRFARVTALELQRQHAHANEVRTVDAFEAFDDHRAHTQQDRALRRPVAAGAGAVFLAADHDQRCAFGLVLHRGVVDRHLLAIVGGVATLDAGDHFVLDADIGKGAAHHHFVVAAARTVGVEVLLRHLVRQQELAAGAVFLDRTGGRDVVGGDAVAKDRQRFGIDDIHHRFRRHGHAVEIGRVGDIGAARAPLVGVGRFDRDRLPMLIAIIDIGIAVDEHRAVDPLKKADDAYLLDNSNLSPEEQLQWVLDLLRDKLAITA